MSVFVDLHIHAVAVSQTLSQHLVHIRLM